MSDFNVSAKFFSENLLYIYRWLGLRIGTWKEWNLDIGRHSFS
jgi:hypothetical protein